MAVMHEPINDPQLVAAANVFVDDIIETAKVEAAQRTMVYYILILVILNNNIYINCSCYFNMIYIVTYE